MREREGEGEWEGERVSERKAERERERQRDREKDRERKEREKERVRERVSEREREWIDKIADLAGNIEKSGHSRKDQRNLELDRCIDTRIFDQSIRQEISKFSREKIYKWVLSH